MGKYDNIGGGMDEGQSSIKASTYSSPKKSQDTAGSQRQKEKRKLRRRKAAEAAKAEAKRFAEQKRQQELELANSVQQESESDTATRKNEASEGAYNPVREGETSYLDVLMQDRAAGNDEDTSKSNALNVSKDVVDETVTAIGDKATDQKPSYTYTTSLDDKGYDGSTADQRADTLIDHNIKKIQEEGTDVYNDSGHTVYTANNDGTVDVKEEYSSDNNTTSTDTNTNTNTNYTPPPPEEVVDTSGTASGASQSGTAQGGNYLSEPEGEKIATRARKKRKGKGKLKIARTSDALQTGGQGGGSGLQIT
jgi:hypothetical protein